MIGDRWTMLVIRDAFLGVRRFDDFQRSLGVARNVLTDRLHRLCEDGILERRPYQQRPTRYDYALTSKGRDLWPVLISLLVWGDRYLAYDGPPRLVLHRDCGGQITDRLTCSACDAPLGPGDVTTTGGPGLRALRPATG